MGKENKQDTEKLLSELEEVLKRLDNDALRKARTFIARLEPSSANTTKEDEDI